MNTLTLSPVAAFCTLGVLLGSMMWCSPVVLVFGGAAIPAGLVVFAWLRRRKFEVDSIRLSPTLEEVAAALATYDREMERFIVEMKTQPMGQNREEN